MVQLKDVAGRSCRLSTAPRAALVPSAEDPCVNLMKGLGLTGQESTHA